MNFWRGLLRETSRGILGESLCCRYLKVNRECRVDPTGARESLVLTDDYRYAEARSRYCMRAGNRTFRTGSDPRGERQEYPSTPGAIRFLRKTDAARKSTVITMHRAGGRCRFTPWWLSSSTSRASSVFVRVKEERFISLNYSNSNVNRYREMMYRVRDLKLGEGTKNKRKHKGWSFPLINILPGINRSLKIERLVTRIVCSHKVRFFFFLSKIYIYANIRGPLTRASIYD